MILSNNRIESGLILNLSCVPGSVLEFNVAHGPPRKTFFSKLLERIKRTVAIVERAMRNGKDEVQIIRFPNVSAPIMGAPSIRRKRVGNVP